MSFTVSMNMKQAFFDRQAVIKAIDRSERRAMSRSLAFIRRRARTQVLRRRKSVSQPGKPPSVHSTNSKVSLKNIIFAYDSARHAGIVGPVRLNQRHKSATPERTTLPALLEAGGTLLIKEEFSESQQRWIQARQTARVRKRKTRRRKVRVQSRPFMEVAMQKEIESGNVVGAWANVVTG